MERIAVCLKWVDLRPEIDPLTGDVSTDARFSGAGPADTSALEWALRLADHHGASVVAVTAGPSPAETMLRLALAAGARSAVRVDTVGVEPSAFVARVMAPVVAPVDVVVCGAASVDRGSGSVPAFLAHELGLPQALGLVSVDDELVAERRLDQGRRERLAVEAPAVLSFERGPELRRGPLAATIAAESAPIEVVSPDVAAGSEAAGGEPAVVAQGPYRPRAKVRPAPDGDTPARIATLIGAGEAPTDRQIHDLDPAAAARLVVDRLTEWGYLDGDSAT